MCRGIFILTLMVFCHYLPSDAQSEHIKSGNFLKSVHDTDGDGVPDSDDLDSDNDGVLDRDEMDCVGNIDLTSLTFSGTAVGEVGSDYLQTASTNAWRSSYSNQALALPIHLKFTYSQAAGYGMLGLIPANSDQNVNNWNDGAYKYYMTPSNMSFRTPTGWSPTGLSMTPGDILEIIIDQSGQATCKMNAETIHQFQAETSDYYLAVTTYYAQSYSNLTLSEGASAQCADRDTDGDSIPDHLDLDSDNDGCSDAYEANATASTVSEFAFTSTAGTATDSNSDGLADEIDQNLDANPDYISEYDLAALDAALANCTDSDADGILDTEDLDDDNDGLLDSEELSCESGNNLEDLSFSGTSIASTNHNTIITANTGAWRSSYSNEALVLPVTLEFTYTSASGSGMLGLIPESAHQNTSTWNDTAYKFYMTGTKLYGRANNSWNPYGIPLAAGDVLSWSIDESGYVTAKQNGTTVLEFQGIDSDYYLAVTSYQGQSYTNVSLTHAAQVVCIDRDTDGDGQPDRIDTDSDNDECFDVHEAGFSDADGDGVLDGTGVNAQGLVIGNTDGYSGINQNVTSPSYFGCDEVVVYHDVNISSDLDDANPGDGQCADANGNCSLRAAIQEVNANSDFGVISFSIDGHIEIQDPLPTILGTVVIDGYSAPGYSPGAPSVKISGDGFNLLYLEESNGSIVQGLDLSGSDQTDFDSYGVVLAWSNDVIIRDNVIRNRVRSIHANNSCGMVITNNDLRDSGQESWDGAVYLINLCPANQNTELEVSDNLFGNLNLETSGGVQVLNASNVITSDGSITGTHISLESTMDMEFPVRYVNVSGGQISRLDCTGNSTSGIGLRLVDCSDIIMDDNMVHRKDVAAHIVGGVRNTITNSDFRECGSDDNYAVVRIEEVHVNQQSDFIMANNAMDLDAYTLLNIIDCSGLVISSDAGDNPHILMESGVMTGHTPFRIQESQQIVIDGFSFRRTDQLIGTEGVILESASNDVTVRGCSFEGFASGVNLASAQNAQLYCNTMVWNRNGVWVFGTSDIDSMEDNSFHCNQVGVYNHTSTPVISSNDYWGDASGSQSLSGTGDHFEGLVQIPSWKEQSPACAYAVDSSVCQQEICDNGIDDDGDGLVDCEDGSCSTSAGCEDDKSFTGFTDAGNEIILNIYPNPSEGQVTVELDSECETLTIRDLGGRVVLYMDNVNEGANSLGLESLTAGMYSIQVSSQSKQDTELLIIK